MCKALGVIQFVRTQSTQQLATRMATLGSIESFNPSLEDWNAYSERFEQYVIANEIKDEKKIVATFLNFPFWSFFFQETFPGGYLG